MRDQRPAEDCGQQQLGQNAMQTLLEPPSAPPHTHDAVVDKRANTAAAAQADEHFIWGWNAFEVWRTRVMGLQPARDRVKLPD